MKDIKILLLSLFSVVLVFSLICPACAPGSDSIADSVVDGSSALSAIPLNTPTGNVTPMVAAGEYHTVGLRPDGTVAAVGLNDHGQCDVGGWTNIVQVSAGYSHTVGLTSDGTVVAVGYNDHGQCEVGGWMNIVQVAAGYFHTVGLRSDGTVVAVGYDWGGTCDVDDWTDIVQVAAGHHDTVGLRSDGTVVAVGRNWTGECDVDGWTNITQVAVAYYHTLGLKPDGTVVAVGENNYGQCNVGDWTNIVQVAAGWRHTVGLRSDGTVVAVGYNYHGQCNVGEWTDIVQIATLEYHTVGLRSDGTVAAVGHDEYGQQNTGEWASIIDVAPGVDNTVGLRSDGTVVAVGRNNHNQCYVAGWTNVIQVTAGVYFTVGLRSDGTVVAVGNNHDGQCNVDDWTDIIQVAATSYHTVGLRSDGTAVAVGDSYSGECNLGDWTDIVQVAAGWSHTVGLKSDGTAVAVGDNYWGVCNLGNWTDIVQVAAGYHVTVGVNADGTAVAVGFNDHGQCDVAGWTDIVQVAAGEYHTVGLKSDGTVVAVGYGGDGQCNVGGWTNIIQVAAGWRHTVGLRSDGTVVAVGDNYWGECNLFDWNLGETALPPDTISPTISSVSPQNGQPDVAIDTIVTATFSEPMDSLTINTESFTLVGSAVSGTVTYNPATYTATFTPAANLGYDHEYTATLGTDIKDLAGNPLAGPYIWIFTTESAPSDTTPPNCGIELREQGTSSQIDTVDIAEFFDIYVGSSTDDTGITEVRFSSDDSQDGTATGEWTEWYDWDISLGDWDAVSKTKAWSFATGGHKEVWAEVKDDSDRSDKSFANIKTYYSPNPYGYDFRNRGVLEDNPHTPADEGLADDSRQTLFINTFDLTGVDEATQDRWFREISFGEGGNCYGMAASSLMEYEYPGYDQFLENQGENCIFELDEPSISQWCWPSYSDCQESDNGWDASANILERPVLKHIIEFQISQWGIPQDEKIRGTENVLNTIRTEFPQEMYILDIYDEGSGHALIPFRVETVTEDDEYRVFVYDSNHPSEQGRAVTIERDWLGVWHWEYDLGWVTWSGPSWWGIFGDTSIELIPIAIAYNGGNRLRLPGTGDEEEATVFLSGEASLIVTDSEGRTAGFINDSFVEEIPNIELIFPITILPDEEPERWQPAFYISNDIDLEFTIERISDDDEGLSLLKLGKGYFVDFSASVSEEYTRVDVSDDGTDISIAGQENEYSLFLNRNIDGISQTFAAIDIPTTSEATHQYSINWEGLSQGEEGVTVQIDSDGDGTVDYTLTSDSVLTGNEFVVPSSGCFIATAAYGTPMADEIEILREFRDKYLLNNPLGQSLVEFYYKVSPPIAEFITEHPSLKPIVRAGLVPAVAVSTVAVSTTPAEKIAILGLAVLISVVVAIWATRRRDRGPEYTRR